MNRIITEKCKTLKVLGKQALSGHWAEVVIFFVITKLIIEIPGLLFGILPESIQTNFVANIANIYGYVITGPINLAIADFFIKMFRQKGTNSKTALQFGFGNFSKAMVLYLRIMVFTWLLSLLFIIPGVLAMINYSQSFFILADNPQKSASQCMMESKFIMQKNRWKYVKLYLSFVPIFILFAIPAAICHHVLDASSIQLMEDAIASGDLYSATYYANQMSPVASILLLLTAVPSSYLFASRTAFFDILCGKLIIQSVDEVQYEEPSDEAEVVGQIFPAEDAPVIDAEYKEVDDYTDDSNE